MKQSPSSNHWITQPVFISSTFQDMNAERDHLVNVVFKNLQEKILSRHVHIESVDLRWGVKASNSFFQY